MNKTWKKRWKKYRGIIIRTIIFLGILVVAFLIAGKKGGFFTISDLKNDVEQTKYENKYGGYTFSKETTPDKVVVWTDSYSETLLPTMDEKQAFVFQEMSDEYNKIMEFNLVYRTDREYDEVVDYYTSYYPDVVLTENGGYATMWTTYLNYSLTITAKEVDGQIEVAMNPIFVGVN